MAALGNDRLANYSFVATILWIGFLLAISFMEAPLRFQAESITVPIALQIGRLVFHGLNVVELVLAIWIFGCQFNVVASKKSKMLLYLALMILTIQTVLLFTVLDARTIAIIAEQDVGRSYSHTIYVVLEAIKLILLAFLAHSQIRDFKIGLIGGKQNRQGFPAKAE